MLEDWRNCIGRISEGIVKADKVEDALHCMYQELLYYKEKYDSLFTDKNAQASYASTFMQSHHLLRKQLAEPMKKWTRNQDKVDGEFLAEFVAENMLALTMEEKPFDLISSVLLQLF